MSENNIKTIEKKVDLLYKILLNLNVNYEIGYPYDMDYLWNFNDELISAFNLDVKEDYINFDFKVLEGFSEKKKKLDSLMENFNKGNYLAKDKNTLQNEIKLLQTNVNLLENIDENREQIIKTIEKLNKAVLQKKYMYNALRKKLGLEPKDFITAKVKEYLNMLNNGKVNDALYRFNKLIEDYTFP